MTLTNLLVWRRCRWAVLVPLLAASFANVASANSPLLEGWPTGLEGQNSRVRTLELSDAGAESVVVHAAIALPAMSDHYRARVEILADVLSQGSEAYPRLTVRRLTGALGSPLRGFTTPGALHLRAEVPVEAWDNALAVLVDAMRRPLLDEAAVRASIETRTLVEPGEWSKALDGLRFDWATVQPREVRELADAILRPERTLVVVAGAHEPRTAAARVAARCAGWVGGLERRWTFESDQRVWFPKGRYVDLLGAPIDPRSEWPVACLAALALGAGKDSTVFRIVRERHAWSYRQEAFLASEGQRWRLRCLVQQAPGSEAPDPDALRQALLADVAAWDESTLARAAAMAKLAAIGRIPSPLQIGTRGRADASSLSGRALLAALWFEATGELWEVEEFSRRCAEVPLAKVKEWATTQLKASAGRIYGASGTPDR